MEKCLERYDQQDIRGYRLIMQKQERIGGRLHPLEVIEVFFRAHPHSVFMHWLKGARRAENLLYVEGENDGKILVHPTGLIGRLDKVVALDPEGPEARAAGRFSVKDFGLRNTLQRTLNHWKAVKVEGTLQAEYLGVDKVHELDDRLCYTLRRRVQPEEDGVTEETLYFDKETWFQVGTMLRGYGGRLMGEYLYRDIQLNPEFKSDQFQPSALVP
jgi:Protein of unknown function (DUF1571)